MVEKPRKADAVDPALCERLRSFRESLGLDQRAFAKASGTPFRTYQDYEHGKSPPKIAFIQRLAAMGCDVAWLVTGERASGRPWPFNAFTPDEELFGQVTEAVARAHKEAGITLSMDKLGRLSAEKYNIIVAAVDSATERSIAVKLMGAELLNELRRAAPGSGKLSA